MKINVYFDKSVRAAPAWFKTDVQIAAHKLDRLIANPIAVNIRVGYGENDGQSLRGALATGMPFTGSPVTYSQVAADLAANATSSADATAAAHLPASDPTEGGPFYIADAQQKAWGLLPARSGEYDGSVGFSSTYSQFDYNPYHRGLPGKVDFIGIALHELTHALGRTAGLQVYEPGYTALDLFRYSAPASFQLTGGQPAYFSIDGGVTNLNNFDTVFDYGDWAKSAGIDAFGYPRYGIVSPITGTDVTELDALGFTIAQNSTELIEIHQTGRSVTTAASGNTVVEDVSQGGNVIAAEGNDTVKAGFGPETVFGSTSATQLHVTLGFSNALVQPNASDATVALGTGAATVVGGSGGLTVSGAVVGGGEDTIFGTSRGLTSIAGGAERMLFVGGSGAAVVTIGGGGGAAYGGPGGSTLVATAPNTSLTGYIGGDQLVVSGIGGDQLTAGSGNETLNGSAANSADTLFGGSGNDVLELGHGADTFVGSSGASTVVAGSGDATMWVGAGPDTFQFVAGQTGGNDVIHGFRPGTDHLSVSGYSGPPALFANNNDTVIQLSDGTRITVAGVSASELNTLA